MRGVVVATHVHPGLVATHIVDTVGNGFAARIVGEIMHQRRPRACSLAATRALRS